MEAGNVASWAVKVGDVVEAGTVLGEIETDKATMEFESTEEGHVAAILVEAGAQNVAVGSPIIVFAESADDVAAFASYSSSAAAAPAPNAPAPAPNAPAPAAPSSTARAPPATAAAASGERIKASPLAKKLAAEKGLSLVGMAGSGPGGRIKASDVGTAAISAPPAHTAGLSHVGVSTTQVAGLAVEDGGYTSIPHSNIRRITASKLAEAKQTVPHFYLTQECRMDALLSLRVQLNSQMESMGGGKVSVNDLVVKAAACALKDVPGVNSAFLDNEIQVYSDVHISVALQTNAGLLVPVLRNVDKLGLKGIASGIKDLSNAGKAGKLAPTDMSGGTFTISNLGMFGIKQFSAIINPPQAAILAVGGTEDRVVPQDGTFVAAKVMAVTLSCDHRAVDGVLGSQWLLSFKKYMEEPTLMLL